MKRYAEENCFDIYKEYIDDGYSGTSFDRPAWNKMITDIENGSINTVMVKDLSRIGRDYIISGQYTEIYFPSEKSSLYRGDVIYFFEIICVYL